MSFAYYDKEKTILYRAPADERVVIPKKVKEIYGLNQGDYAFLDTVLTLKHVVFETGNLLEKISTFAFYSCEKLEEIDLTECKNLQSIGNFAFRLCKNVHTIKFPITSKFTSIGNHCFSDIKFVESIYIPPSVSYFGSSMFQSCKKLRDVNIDKDSKIETVKMWTFFNCPEIRKFYVPNSVTWIGNSFDSDCINFKEYVVEDNHPTYKVIGGIIFSKDEKTIISVPPAINGEYTIPENVTEIGWCAFSDSCIEVINFPSTLRNIYSYGFSGCRVKYVNITTNLTYLEHDAFSYSGVREVYLPKEITYIGSITFSNCKYLTKIRMPDKFETIGSGIFASCPEDMEIIFGPETDLVVRDQKLAYSKDNLSIVLYFGNYQEITINNNVVSIGGNVFYESWSLKRIIFQETSSLKTIGGSAFSRTSITELVIPNSVTTISGGAFAENKKLLTVEMGNSVNYIGDKAFDSDIALTSVIFKNNLYTIGNCAFADCWKLSSIDLGNGPTKICIKAFYNCSVLTELFIPNTIEEIEIKAFEMSGLTNITFAKDAPIDNFTSFLFSGCSNLVTINMPSSVKFLGTYCYEKTKITDFVVPDSLEIIDPFCFNYCNDLKTFTIPKTSNLKEIKFAAFRGCFSFETIVCESPNFKEILGALYDKDVRNLIVIPSNLKKPFFAFPETLQVIQQYGVFHCIHINQIFIPPNSVVEIENNAFEECYNLITINMPKCVTTIGRQSFKACRRLQCGLLIENQNKDYIENLVDVALLPKRCLIRCDKLCSYKRKNSVNVRALVLVSFSSILD